MWIKKVGENLTKSYCTCIIELRFIDLITMNKRGYLIKLLETLTGVRTPAEWFLVILKVWWFDESIVDTLIHLIEKTIQKTNNEKEKMKLQWSLTLLEKIKTMEEESLEQDAEECDALLQEIENIS